MSTPKQFVSGDLEDKKLLPQIEAAFETLDDDGSGEITIREIQEVAASGTLRLPPAILEVCDADKMGDEGVTLGLGQHALARIGQDDRDIDIGRTGRHVAGILLMARCVGDDELGVVLFLPLPLTL